MEFKQLIKNLSKKDKGRKKLKEILLKYKSRLPEQDFWLLEYSFIEKLSIYNICCKFGMAESTYFQAKKNALGKLEVLLLDQEFKEIFSLS